MEQVEFELGQLTNQQADLQKIQVALDRLLAYLSDDRAPRTPWFAGERRTSFTEAEAGTRLDHLNIVHGSGSVFRPTD